jgi:3-deoxy-D-manno-octulosonic-acid transferase
MVANFIVCCAAALVGGTLFTVGAYLGIVEALNVNREVLFGYHVRPHLLPACLLTAASPLRRLLTPA